MRRAGVWRTLYFQVLVAIAAGVLLGILWPHLAQSLKPLGDGFIKLIRLLIAPIIFCTVVTGIAGMAKLRDVGKAGGLALVYFELVTTFALLIGLLVVNVLKPGVGVNADPATLDTHAIAQYATPGGIGTVTEFLLNIIPATFFGAFASGDILQTLLLAILFGFALHVVGGRTNPVFQLIEKSGQVLFTMVSFVMRLAPLGAFGAMAFTVGRYGPQSLVALVIPAGYSFNLDGTSIYLTMAALYIAQATNTPLDLWHQGMLLAVLLLTSKGAAGVTGSGFIVLAASLSAVGHVPVAGLALILGIDRFMSEARALTNLIGNTVATIVVAKWCGGVDDAALRSGLSAPPAASAGQPGSSRA